MFLHLRREFLENNNWPFHSVTQGHCTYPPVSPKIQCEYALFMNHKSIDNTKKKDKCPPSAVNVPTLTMVHIIEYRGDVSVAKLFCFPDQSLFDGLVTGQYHHFFGSKVHGEHRPIFLGQLKTQRTQI